MHLEKTHPPVDQKRSPSRKKRLSIRDLLKPHTGSLAIGLLAVAGEAAANLLVPGPLKLVLDDVLRSRQSHASVLRWIHGFVGDDKLAMLKFACLAVLLIALLDAVASYLERYLTTSVGQWIAHDLRQM